MQTANLTPTQQRVAETILAAINTLETKLVLVDGFSGVGKSTMLDAIKTSIEEHGGIILDYDRDSYSLDKSLQNGTGVMAVTPFEKENIGNRKSLHSGVEVYTLPAMSLDEILEYIGHRQNFSRFATDAIARHYSLGVPLLAQSIMRDKNLTHDEVVSIGAGYLYSHRIYKVENIGDYLQIAPSEHISRALSEMWESPTTNNIYKGIHEVLTKIDNLKARGIEEESPFFTAPQSFRIYNKMLASDRRNILDIYAPNISEEDVKRIREVFANGVENFTKYDVESSNRWQMFRPEFRKIAFWLSYNNQSHYVESEHPSQFIERRIEDFKRITKRSADLTSEIGIGDNSFYVHKHEHPGFTIWTAITGWMVESFLQQRGISYIVDNGLIGKMYVFNPNARTTERIEMI